MMKSLVVTLLCIYAAIVVVVGKSCPDGSRCPNGESCCAMTNGSTYDFGCCPYEDGVCCDGQNSCCSKGFKCYRDWCLPLNDDSEVQSDTFFKPKYLTKSSFSLRKLEDQPCGRGSCPDYATCCFNIGCCPYSNAMCCSDGQHCCPSGMICDTSSQICRQSGRSEKNHVLDNLESKAPIYKSNLGSWFNKLRIRDNAICPDGNYCSDDNTCCLLSDASYGCCPYPSAVCCPDKVHCCPQNTQCDSTSQLCLHQNDLFSSEVKSP